MEVAMIIIISVVVAFAILYIACCVHECISDNTDANGRGWTFGGGVGGFGGGGGGGGGCGGGGGGGCGGGGGGGCGGGGGGC